MIRKRATVPATPEVMILEPGPLAAGGSIIPSPGPAPAGPGMTDPIVHTGPYTVESGTTLFTTTLAYLFERKGQISFAPGVDEDALMEAAMGADADDVVTNEDGSIDVFTSFAGFYSVRNALEAAGFKGDDAEIVMQPTTSAELDLEGAEKVLKLIDMLEDLDDVQNVYSNAQISDEIMENLG